MAKKKIGDVELQWTCPNCNGLNPGSARFCQSCGAAQPEEVDFQLPERQELITEDAGQAPPTAADIHCPFCGTRNQAGAAVCTQCGGDLSSGARRESGQVLGAYQEKPAGTVNCPNCGSENSDLALKCLSCGASLAPEPQAAKPAAPQAASRGRNPLLIAGIAAIVLLVCGVLAWVIFMGTRTEELTATVGEVRWELSIPIEALVPVEYGDWRAEIPAGAEIESCQQEVREVVDQPVANAVEICGTPYTIDSGTGFGEVVQDCVYEVYADFCTYTVEEWAVVDTAVLTGTDFSPVWPDPVLEGGQRLGSERSETYVVVFRTPEGQQTYRTHSFSEFEPLRPGTEWTLQVNGFGDIVGVEP